MLLSEILKHLETLAPPAQAMEWDNVGLMLGDPSWEIHKALICLDVSPAAVEDAIADKCDLILSHHPLIFRPLKNITDPLLIGLISHKIAVVSLHTNLDVADAGVNQALAAKLNLQVQEVLEPETGLGLVCALPSALSLQAVSGLVKHHLNCPLVKLWTAGTDIGSVVQRLAICGGSGASLIDAAAAKAELLITGDVSYHNFLESPIPIIDAGHFYTEYPVLKWLSEYLNDIGLDNMILSASHHEFPRFMHFI